MLCVYGFERTKLLELNKIKFTAHSDPRWIKSMPPDIHQ